MGVPTFFKWLSIKYPLVLKDAIEVTSTLDKTSGQFVPVDTSQMSETNPNGEFDHLYLDMNGIIHPCCHPEDAAAPASEVEMFEAIFAYIDRLLMIVRPRKLLYMAIDGVAPRAKMNQQRTRRFRAAADVEEAREVYEELRAEAEAADRVYPGFVEPWDSNVITPGTPFLAKLSKALRWYICHKQHTEPSWRDLKVILSDANSPGEGEHKIMNFIRAQRTYPNYDPNIKHCLYGADADLIMLGLATHEAHFSILREAVVEQAPETRKCYICNKTGHHPKDCPGAGWTAVEEESDGLSNGTAAAATTTLTGAALKAAVLSKPMQFLLIPVLREYLQNEFAFSRHPDFTFDFERIVDDFILMCFFVGNDFLPHLPSLSIHKGSIDLMILLYQHVSLLPCQMLRINISNTDLRGESITTKTVLMQIRPTLPDYLCDTGKINFPVVRTFVGHLGDCEEKVFTDDIRTDARQKARRDENRRNAEARSAAADALAAEEASSLDTAESEVAQQEVAQQEVAQQEVAQQEIAQQEVSPHWSSDRSAHSNSLNEQRGVAASAGCRIDDQLEDDNVRASRELAAMLHKRRLEDTGNLPFETPVIKRLRTSGDHEPVALSFKGDAISSEQRHYSGLLRTSSHGPRSQPENLEHHQTPSLHKIESVGQTGLLGEPAQQSMSSGKSTGPKPRCRVTNSGGQVLEKEAPVDMSSTAAQIDYFKKRQRDLLAARNEVEQPEDAVKLGVGNRDVWRPAYYKIKFDSDITDGTDVDSVAAEVARHYAQGLAWVLAYYYQGVPSWSWFYPYHYSPLASDLAKFGFQATVPDPFELGVPFKPFEQLMAVLPARSRHCLPEFLADLMVKEESPLEDFYPLKFKSDPDGKRFRWQWVVKLPFIDEERLLRVVRPLVGQLASVEEQQRNSVGQELLFVSQNHALAPQMCLVQNSPPEQEADVAKPLSPVREKLNPDVSGKLCGEVTHNQKGVLPGEPVHPGPVAAEDSEGRFPELVSASVGSALIVIPAHRHQSCMLPGAQPPAKMLTPGDLADGTDTPGRGPGRFNCAAAKRMIIGVLGKKGLVSNAVVDQYFTKNADRRQNIQHVDYQQIQRSHGVHSDNRYAAEMGYHKSHHNGYQQMQRSYGGAQFDNRYAAEMGYHTAHHVDYYQVQRSYSGHYDNRYAGGPESGYQTAHHVDYHHQVHRPYGGSGDRYAAEPGYQRGSQTHHFNDHPQNQRHHTYRSQQQFSAQQPRHNNQYNAYKR